MRHMWHVMDGHVSSASDATTSKTMIEKEILGGVCSRLEKRVLNEVL